MQTWRSGCVRRLGNAGLAPHTARPTPVAAPHLCGYRHLHTVQRAKHGAEQSRAPLAGLWSPGTRGSGSRLHASGLEQPAASGSGTLTILVLGGTGFVGQTFIKAARRQGHSIVSLSRRGKLPGTADDPSISWVQGDATDAATVQGLLAQHPHVDACLHCVGLLLDEGSGLSRYNRLASGSGSEPGPGATYDAVTRVTALNAIDALGGRSRRSASASAAPAGGRARVPFVFVSAAEAGWTFRAPVPWLERYLEAKRAVEATLSKEDCPVRGVMLRPSLIWSPERPQALLSVLPFYLGHALGLPFVDKPVQVETLCQAALVAMQDENVLGVQRFMDMELLAARK